jgi:hypothetical protein
MSSSNESPNRRMVEKWNWVDIWMVVASVGFLAGYLSIRARISNYMYVVRWLVDLAKSLLGG